MLHIILFDSELETIPENLWIHPAVKKYAERRGKRPKNMLLDSSYHHQAIRKYFPGEENRRGRPDIVHLFLLNALESILNYENKLRIYIHTRNNDVIKISPETKIPRAYHRFVGLMESLFQNKYVPDKEHPLMWMEKKDLFSLIKEIDIPNIFLMDENSTVSDPGEFLKPESIVLIGGFPEGKFISNVNEYQRKSIYNKRLMAWAVANEIIVNYKIIYCKLY
ncbi:MAG: 16S rRNA methyltransferase [Thermoplasmata archaeon]